MRVLYLTIWQLTIDYLGTENRGKPCTTLQIEVITNTSAEEKKYTFSLKVNNFFTLTKKFDQIKKPKCTFFRSEEVIWNFQSNFFRDYEEIFYIYYNLGVLQFQYD